MPLNTDIRTVQMRILELEAEHRELDHVIEELTAAVVVDELAIRRLKKRKLQIKDQISLLAGQLSPSEPA
ncbi:MAG: hypothetical protein RL483_3 [Pseudomonadota bacterium]